MNGGVKREFSRKQENWNAGLIQMQRTYPNIVSFPHLNLSFLAAKMKKQII